jgi:hypothetical protein
MSTADVSYALEPGLDFAEFIDVLVRSTLAERRPVGEPETIRGMLKHADVIVTARATGLLVGVSRAITDFSYCTYLSDLAVDRVAFQRAPPPAKMPRIEEAAMLETIALSPAALAVLRFRTKGYRMPVTEQRLPAFRELVAAGIMESVPGAEGNAEADFRFTTDDRERHQAWLDAAEAYLRSLEPRLPDQIDLSEAARSVLRRLVAGERVEVTAATKPAYQELAVVGIMAPLSTFAHGPESAYRFTHWGWERRVEWLESGCARETA